MITTTSFVFRDQKIHIFISHSLSHQCTKNNIYRDGQKPQIKIKSKVTHHMLQ